MAEVSLWSGDAPAQLAPGASATVEFVIPEALASRLHEGDTVPAWWFDLDAGLWREEGAGTLRSSAAHPGKLVWVVQMNHFTWINCDMPWQAVSCLNVRAVDAAGVPIRNQLFEAEGISYAGRSVGVTDSDGRTCIVINRGGTVRVSIGTAGLPGHASAVVTGSGMTTVCGSDACTPVTIVTAPPICVPGAYQACPYSGPAGTLGHGLCRAGRKQCGVDGMQWSACTGEVLPVAESCRTPFDDDCDGEVNEGCSCSDRLGLACYTGPAGTKGRGQCHNGTVGCGLFGEEVCTGQRLPRAETCTTLGDENCDGVDACPVLPKWIWTPELPTSSECSSQQAAVRGLAQDGAGNLLTVGSLVGTYRFGSTSLTGDGGDLFVAKFDAAGVLVWSKLLDVVGEVKNPLIGVDRDGNVLVAGNLSGSLVVDGVALASGTGSTPIVVKLSPNGALRWAQRFEPVAGAASVRGLATDPTGNVAVTGGLNGTLRIGSVEHAVSSQGAFYVAKLAASTGAPLWSRSREITQGYGVDAALDEDGNVLLVGSFVGTDSDPFVFDGTVLTTTSSGPDVFVARLDGGTGSTLWVRKVGTDSTADQYPSVNIDRTGIAWVLTWTPPAEAPATLALAKLDSTGNVLLASTPLRNTTDFYPEPLSWRMAVDGSGNMVLAGSSPNGTKLVAWYDANGVYVAHRSYGGWGGAFYNRVFGNGVAVDASGNVVLGGSFNGNVDFGSGFLSSCADPRYGMCCRDYPFLLKLDPVP